MIEPLTYPEDSDAVIIALIMALALHAAIIIFIIAPPLAKEPLLIPLGSMEFDYDPLGGEPGGGEAGTPAPAEVPPEETPPPEEVLPEPIPEPEPEPEVVEEPDEVSVVESIAPEAVETPAPPPPKPVETPKPKPRPKPRPQPQPQPPAQPSANEQTGTGTGGLSDHGTGTGTGGGEGTGQGGYGGGTGRGTSDAMAAYLGQVRRKLERYRKYPSAARSQRLEGVVMMHFTLNRQGQVVGSKMVSSSGHPILDDEAQALIYRVNPLPAFPKQLTLNVLDITVPIQFALR